MRIPPRIPAQFCHSKEASLAAGTLVVVEVVVVVMMGVVIVVDVVLPLVVGTLVQSQL